jgi:septum formation protein
VHSEERAKALMLLPRPLILASRSPRRFSLLSQIGLSPRVVSCDIPEEFDLSRSPAENAQGLAELKAACVATNIAEGIVLGADTIVVIDGVILGKPVDGADAMRMLGLLGGRTHTVHTGFALIDRPSGRSVSGVESTQVTFRDIPRKEIEDYVRGGSPMDKAGAYGIQDDYGAVFVTRVDGCYYNVVGLPLARVFVELRRLLDSNASPAGC